MSLSLKDLKILTSQSMYTEWLKLCMDFIKHLEPVSACSRHKVTPLTSHLNAVKKIFKYLKGQPKLGLWYPKDSPFQLEAYSDSDYAGSHGDRKSTTGSLDSEPVAGLWTKHIEIRHHFIRDANEKNLIQVLKIHTDDNVADLLTKAFDGPRFALVSAGCTMVLLVVILPAGRMVSAGWSMVLLVVIFPAARLVSAAMDYAADSVNMLVGILLLVDPFLLIGCMFLLTAGFLLLDDSFLLAEYIPAAGVVYAVITSIRAAGLISAGGIMFLLADLFLLVVTSFYCAQLNIAGWLVYATSHLVSAGSMCWSHINSAD
ncbi:hypothetical protein Tco_0937866 [Tanacetum coccineum]|uniref:Uncharacterized protein n=1 Tax=Tanacetum coccineum TaxID=301880 RepID=A0ABQ5DFH2_9ASTR